MFRFLISFGFENLCYDLLGIRKVWIGKIDYSNLGLGKLDVGKTSSGNFASDISNLRYGKAYRVSSVCLNSVSASSISASFTQESLIIS